MATHSSSSGDTAAQPVSLALPEIVWDIALLDLAYEDLLNLALCCTATFELLKPQLRAFHYSMDASKALPTYASAPLIRRLRHSVKHAAYSGEEEVALRAALGRASGVRSFVWHGSSYGSVKDFPRLWKTVRDKSWRSLRNVEVVTLDRYAVFEGEPQVSDCDRRDRENPQTSYHLTLLCDALRCFRRLKYAALCAMGVHPKIVSRLCNASVLQPPLRAAQQL